MSKEIKVVGWVHSEYPFKSEDAIIGGLGGFFNWKEKGMRWKNYLYTQPGEWHPYLEALRKEIIENEIKITGETHQYANSGTPLFSDGKIGCWSFRGWGDLMAAIWSEEENKDYTYMDFYM